MFSPFLQRLGKPRFYSAGASRFNAEALDAWILSAQSKQLILSDSLAPGHAADLYITLPTRDGTRNTNATPPTDGTPLAYGHHLAFFHPRNPEPTLRSDGTDADFCPPEPFTRRMWAGGTFSWDNSNPLLIGQNAFAHSTVTSVAKKRFEGPGNPMVFVDQTIWYTAEGNSVASITEERSHVYVVAGMNKQVIRPVDDLPPSPDFSFTYTPSPTTLFRFSALTFNGHYIHLDKDYAQHVEGYPERLVHGPLTALMLLETAIFHNPGLKPSYFEYRARNPVIVNRVCTINGAWEGKKLKLWCVDENGTVGMTGRLEVA